MSRLGGVALLVLLSCASGPRAGVERGNCYGNGSCNAGLVCLSNLCVRPAAPPAVAAAPAPKPDTRDRPAECNAIYQHMSEVAKLKEAFIPAKRDIDKCLDESLTEAQVKCMMDSQKLEELAACAPHKKKHDEEKEESREPESP